MRNYIKSGGVAITLTLTLYVSQTLAQPSFDRPGLKEITQEESRKIHKRNIKRVNPNKFGLERANKERRYHKRTPLPERTLPEMELAEPSSGATNTVSAYGMVAASSAPTQVDNSLLPSFPAIGDQGNLASCVAWATTYYLMSHEVCLTLGCDNKTARTRLYSPKWTYNMINEGIDDGSYFSDAFDVLTKHGAALWTDFPYNTDYRGWDMNSEHWKRAINSRMQTSSYTNINTTAGMTNIKQMLANGHVVLVGTYINSWVYRTVKANPAATSNPFVGQQIATHLNGTAVAHAMTIVGYDDTIWVDINGNGIVETQELGAFKIANSFGNRWKNQGYAWASYDAFRTASAVKGFAPAGRRQLTQTGNAYFATYQPYTPKLLAEVKMSHARRSQISLQFGSSTSTATSPSTTWTPAAFANSGGKYAFDGSTVEKTGSFFFDISSLAGADVNKQTFYLILKDNASGVALTTSAFNIVNPSVGNTLMSAPGVPIVADANKKTLVIRGQR